MSYARSDAKREFKKRQIGYLLFMLTRLLFTYKVKRPIFVVISLVTFGVRPLKFHTHN